MWKTDQGAVGDNNGVRTTNVKITAMGIVILSVSRGDTASTSVVKRIAAKLSEKTDCKSKPNNKKPKIQVIIEDMNIDNVPGTDFLAKILKFILLTLRPTISANPSPIASVEKITIETGLLDTVGGYVVQKNRVTTPPAQA